MCVNMLNIRYIKYQDKLVENIVKTLSKHCENKWFKKLVSFSCTNVQKRLLFTGCFRYINSNKIKIWVDRKIVPENTFLSIYNAKSNSKYMIFSDFYKMTYQICRKNGPIRTEVKFDHSYGPRIFFYSKYEM